MFRRVVLGAAAVAMALALAACGGGGGSAGRVAETKSATKADPVTSGSQFTGNGWYWKEGQGGTGVMFEAQGERGFFAIFMYEDNGRPVWYTGEGAFSKTTAGFSFSGQLLRYKDGSAIPRDIAITPTSAVVGSVTIAFTGARNATTAKLSLPGGKLWDLKRFDFGGADFGPAANQTETGWYWDPRIGGRGYAFEIQGNRFFGAAFHYAGDGQPQWNTIEGSMSSGVVDGAAFNRYSGGESLASAYRAPGVPVAEGAMTVSYSRPCDGSVMLPNSGSWTALSRFSFGESNACRGRTQPNPNEVTTSITESEYGLASEERKAWNVVNTERSRCGFGTLTQEVLLDTAARAHADYLQANPANFISHTEVAARPGYYAASPSDRATRAGYGGNGVEVFAVDNSAPRIRAATHIRNAFANPYDAETLTSRATAFGSAFVDTSFVGMAGTMASGGQAGKGLRTWPCEGTVDTQPVGKGGTLPPFPGEPDSSWGTPILVRGDGLVTLSTVTIKSASGPVSLKAIYGDGKTIDPNGVCQARLACIIPTVLAPLTVYTVSLTGTDNGAIFSRSFNFRTGKLNALTGEF